MYNLTQMLMPKNQTADYKSNLFSIQFFIDHLILYTFTNEKYIFFHK